MAGGFNNVSVHAARRHYHTMGFPATCALIAHQCTFLTPLPPIYLDPVQVIKYQGPHREAPGKPLGVFINCRQPQHGLTPNPQVGGDCSVAGIRSNTGGS